MHRPNSAKPISATSGNTRMWRISEHVCRSYYYEIKIVGDVDHTCI